MEIVYKKPTYEELGKEFGVTRGAVQQYPKRKRSLMLKGLFLEKLIREQNEKDLKMKNKIELYFKLEKEVVAKFIDAGLPIIVDSEDVDGRTTITNFTLEQIGTNNKITFTCVTRNGETDFDFEESLLDELIAYRKNKTISKTFKDYIDYKSTSRVAR